MSAPSRTSAPSTRVTRPQTPARSRRAGVAAPGLSSPSLPSQRVGSARRVSLATVFRSETSNYFLLLGTTLLLVFIGLVMVLSASSVDSFLSDQNFFGGFARQAMYAGIGIPLMLVVARFPATFWRRWARVIVLVGIAIQLLVFTPLGYESGGNRNWISIGSFTAQPSELLKLAVAVWLGVMLPVSMERHDTGWKALRPLVPVVIMMGLVLIGGDLGTVMVMALMTLGALFFAGVNWRLMMVPIVAGLGGIAFMSVISPNRMARILSFLGQACVDDSGACWQPLHGTWAMASGGVFGVGLGNSRAKWSWLPAADNDYIFAIIGEELGLIGAILIIGLFVAMTIAFLRIIRVAPNTTVRIVTGTVMVWLVGQAFINIAVVLGLMPVLGVPLPFLSSGGTALLSCLVAVGLVLSFVRTQDRLAS